MTAILLLMLIALVLGAWLHSFGHYFFARYLLKLPSRLNLGIGSWRKSGAKQPGIHLGWFPLVSRYDLLVNDEEKGGIDWPRFKFFSTYLFGILWSLLWAFIFLVLANFTSPGALQDERFLEKIPPIVQKVLPGGPAEQAGIKPLDKIVDIEGKSVDRFEDVQKTVQASQGPLQLRVLRGEEIIELSLTPKQTPNGTKIIGIVAPEPQPVFLKYDLLQSIQASWKSVLDITGSSSSMLGGPYQLVRNKSFPGPNYLSLFFLFLAHVSLALAVWNLIPLPPLDLGNALGLGLGLSFTLVRKFRFLGILAIAVLLIWKFYGPASF